MLLGSGAIGPAAIADPDAEVGRGGRIEADAETDTSGGALQGAPVFCGGKRAGKELVTGVGFGRGGDAEVGFAARDEFGDGPLNGVSALAETSATGAFQTQRLDGGGQDDAVAGRIYDPAAVAPDQ